MTTLAHRAPALQPVVIQVNIDITPLFWPLFAVAWLVCLAIRRATRALGRLYEIIRAVIVVSGRRIMRRLRGNLRLIEWQLSGLLWGPVMGVG